MAVCDEYVSMSWSTSDKQSNFDRERVYIQYGFGSVYGVLQFHAVVYSYRLFVLAWSDS